MPFFSRGEDRVDDFDEYDPTPYAGGYDIVLTYGRPIRPCEEICYENSYSTSNDFDNDRPQYSSYSVPNAYGEEALQTEYSSYARRKPRPAAAFRPSGGEGGFGGGLQQGYDIPPGVNRPGYGESEYEAGYGRKPDYEAPNSEYGSGYGRKPDYEAPGSEYGSGYGRRTEYENPSSEYGSGYGRKPEHETGESEYGSSYGRKPSYGGDQGGGHGYGGGTERPDYETPGYGRNGRPGYGDEPPMIPSYGRPAYESQGEGEYGYDRPSYERRNDDDEPRRSGYGEESYGRKKYGDNDYNDDDDDEKHRYKHHHRRDYDE